MNEGESKGTQAKNDDNIGNHPVPQLATPLRGNIAEPKEGDDAGAVRIKDGDQSSDPVSARSGNRPGDEVAPRLKGNAVSLRRLLAASLGGPGRRGVSRGRIRNNGIAPVVLS